jgi:putative aminopeptidase FrvX
MARRIVVVVYLRLASDHFPDRVGLAVLLELFARHELTGRARLETVV